MALLGRLLRDYYIYLVLVGVVVVISLANVDDFSLFERGNFSSRDSTVNLLRSSVPLLTISGAFTLLMIAGYIDLSVGSAISLSAVVYTYLVLNGVGFVGAFLLVMVLGVTMGVLNAVMVVGLKITPVIATLVSLSLFKGLALLIVPDGQSSIKGSADNRLPDSFNDFARGKWFLDLPVAFYVAVVITVIFVVVQRRTKLGKYSAAIGGNANAARLSGINDVRIVAALYVLVGLTAAVAGAARASFMSVGDPLSGDGIELTVIIAVLLGGTAFSGGEGKVARSFVGALIIMSVTVGMLTIVPGVLPNTDPRHCPGSRSGVQPPCFGG